MKLLLLLLVLFCFTACDPNDPDETNKSVEPQLDVIALPADTDFPITIEGTLELDIEEGEVGEDGISEYNFGALIMKDGILLVFAHGSVIRSSNFARGDYVEAKVTLSGSDEIDADDEIATYQISKIETLN